MSRQIVEITSSSYRRVQSPRLRGTPHCIHLARRRRKPYLHAGHLSDSPVFNQLFHLPEIRQIAPVIGHEARHARFLAHAIHAHAIFIRRCQGFLHIDGFSRPHCHDGKRGVGARRRRHIDGVHVGVVHELLRVGVPPFYPVSFGIRRGALCRAAHHRHHLRPCNLVECRTRFPLNDLTAANKTPSDMFHVSLRMCVCTQPSLIIVCARSGPMEMMRMGVARCCSRNST